MSHNLEKEQSAGAYPGMTETPGLLQRWSQNLSNQLCSRSESKPGARTVVPGPVGGIGLEESLTLGCLLLPGGMRDMEVVHRLDLQALSVVGAPVFPPVTWLCRSTSVVSRWRGTFMSPGKLLNCGWLPGSEGTSSAKTALS